MSENESLETIDLGENKIGDEGAESIANCFIENQSIRGVYLGDNNITDDGARKLIGALKRNDGIKQIYMWGNPISDHVKAEMAKLLEDPKRKMPHAQTEHLIATIVLRDKEIATKDQARMKAEKNVAEAS